MDAFRVLGVIVGAGYYWIGSNGHPTDNEKQVLRLIPFILTGEFLKGAISMKAILAVVIMTVTAVIGFFVGITVDVPMECAILFAMISGIGCIIQAINHKPQDEGK